MRGSIEVEREAAGPLDLAGRPAGDGVAEPAVADAAIDQTDAELVHDVPLDGDESEHATSSSKL